MEKTRVQSIVLQDAKVLFGYGKDYHFFIGGGLEEGETPEQGALRELKEEANVEGKIVFQIDEPELGLLVGPNSFYQSHLTFLVDIGNKTPALGYDPEETDTGDQVGLAGLQMVPLSDIGSFTWIDIRYFAALRSECARRGAGFPWLGQMNDLLKIWRVK